ncbi:DUF4169 family protein [Roseovarius dicentrarchi]|uniref:DUF4169 family protein n=1 Tax=Roseovarius dicentrarchi TaxID=2250573 RepID=UPI000DE85944|nr:DUF4169 family protein [Roseovarius dicentrarchi]
MTDAPINLNRARKQRARDDAKKLSDENAVRFGRTKAQKQLEKARSDKAAKAVDSHKREP